MYLFNIIETKKGDFAIVREDGRRMATRARLSHAKEVRDSLNFEEKYLREAQQIVRDKKALKMVKLDEDVPRPYQVVDRYGVVVRSFQYGYLARCWLERYNKERESEARETEQVDA